MPKRTACSAWNGAGQLVGRFDSMEEGARFAGCQLEGVRRAILQYPKRSAGGYFWKREEPIEQRSAPCPRCGVVLAINSANFAQRKSKAGNLIRNGCCRQCDSLRQKKAWRVCSACGKKHRAQRAVCFRCLGVNNG